MYQTVCEQKVIKFVSIAVLAVYSLGHHVSRNYHLTVNRTQSINSYSIYVNAKLSGLSDFFLFKAKGNVGFFFRKQCVINSIKFDCLTVFVLSSWLI